MRELRWVEMGFDCSQRVHTESRGKHVDFLPVGLGPPENALMRGVADQSGEDRNVSPPVWRAGAKPSARPQDALDLRDEGCGFVHVLKHIISHDEVEVSVWKWKRLTGPRDN